jgi:hypothetical protein
MPWMGEGSHAMNEVNQVEGLSTEAEALEQIRPLVMDQATHKQGQELQEVLRLLKQSSTSPLSMCFRVPYTRRLCSRPSA